MSSSAYNTRRIITNPAKPPRAQFKPTPNMIAAAENVILAMTIYSAIRPVVESYQKKILAQREWVSDPATSGAVASQNKCDDFQIGATGFSEDTRLYAVVHSKKSLTGSHSE